MKNALRILLCSTLLTACSASSLYNNSMVNPPQVTELTPTGKLLAALPPPKRPVPVAVYDFQDQTGQFRNNGLYTDYSSAVTKGGISILVKALLDTGHGQWFTVAERNGLNDLIKERQIIRTMRSDYTRPDGTKLPDLPPLIYGGMLLEGSIVFYDSNVVTGGAAAGYFGITGSTEYHRDIVTVYMRAIDINNGKVILSVNSSKTLFSYSANAGIVHYLTYNRLLEAEGGYSVNEPSQLAVSQAIEAGLYSLIMEGAQRKLWGFADEAAGKKAMAEYIERKVAEGGDVSTAVAPVEETPGTPPNPSAAAAPAAPAAPVAVQAPFAAAHPPLPAQASPTAPTPAPVSQPPAAVQAAPAAPAPVPASQQPAAKIAPAAASTPAPAAATTAAPAAPAAVFTPVIQNQSAIIPAPAATPAANPAVIVPAPTPNDAYRQDTPRKSFSGNSN